MAEKETKNEPKDLIEPVPEEVAQLDKANKSEETPTKKEEPVSKRTEFPKGKGRFSRGRTPREDPKVNLESWIPKTKLGMLVKAKKEKDLDKILQKGKKILEPEIIDSLIDLESDLILIGQAKGKFGGGKRRAWRQTQKKTQEGNVLSFSTMAVVGDKKEHIGVGYGKAKETLPAREKAVRNAKLNIIKIKLGFESPESDSGEIHTVPFKVEGKCGSIRITLLPAPRGTGLVIGDECKKILKLAGIKDVYSRTYGKTKTTFNLAKACVDALSKTTKMRMPE